MSSINVIQKDCSKVHMRANYFDTLITDPPYGLGFMGKDWDYGVPGVRFWKRFLKWCKPGATALVFGGTRTHHRLMCAMEDAGWEIRDCMMWLYGSGFPKSLDISKAIDKKSGAKRKIIAPKPYTSDKSIQGNSYGKGGYERVQEYYTAPATNLAQLWNGYGTALKPAWEPIIVAMKPLDGTFAHNAEKHGVAGLWIDGGRIGFGDRRMCGTTNRSGETSYVLGKRTETRTQEGRWPANLILDEQVGAGEPWKRYFYCPKASRKERNAGLENMPKKDSMKWSGGSDKMAGIAGTYPDGRPRPKQYQQNNHPTVKPLALMEYLCKLTRTPEGGRVLDPFAGSGTTGLACLKTDRDCTLIEMEEQYCEIIKARVKAMESRCKD